MPHDDVLFIRRFDYIVALKSRVHLKAARFINTMTNHALGRRGDRENRRVSSAAIAVRLPYMRLRD